ncbi:MAG: HAD-IC family P-type ATPase, partial [Mesorhizobium sp.]|nr:HAD-IC family P-type ATPase [Mesorhizobium sp.]
ARSRHPLSRAIVSGLDGNAAIALSDIVERPGLGIEAHMGGDTYRLGRAEWALAKGDASQGTVLGRNGALAASFSFEDALRPGASAAIASLRSQGVDVSILSGDQQATVAATAHQLGVQHYEGALLPGAKVGALANMAGHGKRTLMVGDGLNDAPALAAAHVSMAPATAADIGRNAADFVFLHESLAAVPTALAVAREAGRLVRQNFALAIIYNAIALPIAIAGYVTPLIAALAMSLSSVLVVANALRLRAGKLAKPADKARPVRPSAAQAIVPAE